MAKSSKLQRTLFLYVIPTLVAVLALSFIAATVFGLGLFETPAQLTRMAQGRGAHIVQALVNFALLAAVCACGALLCTENGIKTRRGLIAAAEKMGAPYAVDVYPRYGSDVEATLRAGYDLRHGLIGSGVYASHGYERSHIEGALATLKTLAGYVK